MSGTRGATAVDVRIAGVVLWLRRGHNSNCRIDARVDGASPPRTQGVQGPVEQVARRQHRLVDLVQEAVVIARRRGGLQRRQGEGEDSADASASHYFPGGACLGVLKAVTNANSRVGEAFCVRLRPVGNTSKAETWASGL